VKKLIHMLSRIYADESTQQASYALPSSMNFDSFPDHLFSISIP